MKRILWMLAVAAMAVTACQKPQYIIPLDDDEEEENPGEEEGFKEKTFMVNITMKDGVNNNYDGVVGTLPGNEILEFLDLTKEEFYKGMGTCTTGNMSTSQSDNTILFGVANANSSDDLKWIPSTSNNFGHWLGKDGAVVTWGDDAYIFTESLCEWGKDAPSAEDYDAMWTFTVGAYPGHTAAGETYKATEVFFRTSDDDVELYAYVQWNVTIEAAEEVKLNVVETQEINVSSAFEDNYAGHALVPEINTDALQAAIGIPYDEADVYGVNADGSFSLAPGKNFWFSIAGDIIGWQSAGGENGICINDDRGTNEWAWCMYPYDGLGGQALKGAVAFVNPATLSAYVVKVTVNVEGIDFLNIDVLVPLEGSRETEYVLNENNLAALAAALGVESVTAEEIGTTSPLKGINADGSVHDGGFTANNGYWYSLNGNVTNWAGVEAAGYVGAYIEYRGDYKFGCGMWEESGKQATVKIGVGDAVLTFNLTVDEPAVFNTEEAGTMAVSASQAVSDGYSGGQIVLNADEVAALIGEGEYTLLNLEGKPEYTANGGFWFGPDGQPSEWATGVFFFEPAEEPLTFNTGIHPDNVTEPATLKASCRLANLETMKHITLNITVTAE